MGQQQLLLLVLGIVIVGLAVVVGIEAFSENQRKAEVDRYTEMGVAMAGDLIAFYQKAEAQGGAGRDATRLGTVTLSDLGYRSDRTDTWAGFDRTGIVTSGVVRYLGQDATHPFFHIHKLPLAGGDTRVEVHAFGPSSACIVVRHDVRGVSATWSDGKVEGEAPDAPAGCSW